MHTFIIGGLDFQDAMPNSKAFRAPPKDFYLLSQHTDAFQKTKKYLSRSTVIQRESSDPHLEVRAC